MKVLDARGLEPPAPFERAVEALADLAPGEVLTLLLERVPFPLFRILDRDGHAYAWQDDGQGTVSVRISAAGEALSQGD